MCYCLDCGRRISCITLETDGLCAKCRASDDAFTDDVVSLDALRERLEQEEERKENEDED